MYASGGCTGDSKIYTRSLLKRLPRTLSSSLEVHVFHSMRGSHPLHAVCASNTRMGDSKITKNVVLYFSAS